MDRSYQMTMYESPLYTPPKKSLSPNSITKNGVKKMFVISENINYQLDLFIKNARNQGDFVKYSDVVNYALRNFLKKNV